MVIAIHTKPIEFSFICSLGLITLLCNVTLYIFLDKNCNIHFINLRFDYLKHGRLSKKIFLDYANSYQFNDFVDILFHLFD